MVMDWWSVYYLQPVLWKKHGLLRWGICCRSIWAGLRRSQGLRCFLAYIRARGDMHHREPTILMVLHHTHWVSHLILRRILDEVVSSDFGSDSSAGNDDADECILKFLPRQHPTRSEIGYITSLASGSVLGSFSDFLRGQSFPKWKL